MTEQSPNSAFHAQSFLNGANADYVDLLAGPFAADPNSVDPQWAEFFRALGNPRWMPTRRRPGQAGRARLAAPAATMT